MDCPSGLVARVPSETQEVTFFLRRKKPVSSHKPIERCAPAVIGARIASAETTTLPS